MSLFPHLSGSLSPNTKGWFETHGVLREEGSQAGVISTAGAAVPDTTLKCFVVSVQEQTFLLCACVCAVRNFVRLVHYKVPDFSEPVCMGRCVVRRIGFGSLYKVESSPVVMDF